MQKAVIIDMFGFHAYDIGTIVEVKEFSEYFGCYSVSGHSTHLGRTATQFIRPFELAFLMPYNPS